MYLEQTFAWILFIWNEHPRYDDIGSPKKTLESRPPKNEGFFLLRFQYVKDFSIVTVQLENDYLILVILFTLHKILAFFSISNTIIVQ